MIGEQWHLDKRVQIGMIGALLLQASMFGWWASALQSQVAEHDRRLVRAEAREDSRIINDRAFEGRMARIEEGIRALLETAQRLERRIDGPDRR